MKIIIEELQSNEEEHISIKCRNMTPEILKILDSFKAQNILIAYSGNEIYRIESSSIYYIETVDNRSFLYCDNNVYESKNKLFELEEKLSGNDFLRISKSVIVNLSKIKKLIPALSGRFEAVLMNDFKVIISRQYVSELKIKLEI
jgi:DNA-binding LytR/AlgR family response regulator